MIRFRDVHYFAFLVACELLRFRDVDLMLQRPGCESARRAMPWPQRCGRFCPLLGSRVSPCLRDKRTPRPDVRTKRRSAPCQCGELNDRVFVRCVEDSLEVSFLADQVLEKGRFFVVTSIIFGSSRSSGDPKATCSTLEFYHARPRKSSRLFRRARTHGRASPLFLAGGLCWP